MTPFETKCEILAKMMMLHDEEFSDIWEHHDMSIILAYSLANGYVPSVDSRAKEMIEKLFDVMLAECEVEKDTGFSSYGEIYGQKGDSEV